MPDETRSYDPEAIRIVANNDLDDAATDLQQSRAAFTGVVDHISTATQSAQSWFGSGFDPLGNFASKFSEASKAIYAGSTAAQSNLENTIEGLRKTADQYELDEAESAETFDSLDDGY